MFVAHQPAERCADAVAEINRYESYLRLFQECPAKVRYQKALEDFADTPIRKITADTTLQASTTLDSIVDNYYKEVFQVEVGELVHRTRMELLKAMLESKGPKPDFTFSCGVRSYHSLHLIFVDKRKIGILNKDGSLKPEVELAFLFTKRLDRNFPRKSETGYIQELISIEVTPSY